MAKSIRARATKKAKAGSALHEALKFVYMAQKKDGLIWESHCQMANGWVMATDGRLTVGAKIEEDIRIAPHTETLMKALAKCGEKLTMTQQTNLLMVIQSDKFRANIPCADITAMPPLCADERCATLTPVVTDAFALLAPLVNESDTRAYLTGVRLQANTATATNGHAIIEFWHGIDLPPGLLIPKASAMAVVKCGKVLNGFGFTEKSVTFHFEDDSFIKTVRIDGKFPDIDRLFKGNFVYLPLPDDFHEALDGVSSFTDSETGSVLFQGGKMKTSMYDHKGASFECEGLPDLPEGMGISVKLLNLCRNSMAQADFQTNPDSVQFTGENTRGKIMYLKFQDSKI